MPQVDVSTISAQLGDFRRKVASIHDAMQELLDEELTLVAEFNELEPGEENDDRITEINERLEVVRSEHSATEPDERQVGSAGTRSER